MKKESRINYFRNRKFIKALLVSALHHSERKEVMTSKLKNRSLREHDLTGVNKCNRWVYTGFHYRYIINIVCVIVDTLFVMGVDSECL